MALRIRTKVWVENSDGKLVIGTGRLRILEATREVGSVSKAAQKVGQPYRAVWGMIRATEKRCGVKLVERVRNGSILTKKGLELLSNYTELKKRCENYADKQFTEILDEGSQR